MSAIESIAIVLSLVALIVTIIGFFASLQFYRHGMELQGRADQVLAKIEERASAIQTQVGGVFDKTLDAALGRTTSKDAEEQQKRMLRRSPEDPPVAAGGAADAPPVAGLASSTELALAVHRYYTFRQLRVTNVSDPTAQAIFQLGSGSGFNLLDGIPGIVFLGYFVGVAPVEVVARIRTLFVNLEISYKRLEETADLSLRNQATRLLDQVSVELLVDETVDRESLVEAIEQFQPKARRVSVTLLAPQDIRSALEEEMRRMQP